MTLIVLHVLQNHVPSNLNRDENGDPKDCVFGGFRRARISSQSLKYTIRNSPIFNSYFAAEDVGATRSKLPDLIVRYLDKSGISSTLPPEQLKKIQVEAGKIGKSQKPKPELPTRPLKAKKGKKQDKQDVPSEGDEEHAAEVPEEEETDDKIQLMILTNQEVERIAHTLVDYTTESDTPKKPVHFGSYPAPLSVPIALFGRMTTSSPFLDVAGAVQVAHAFATSRIETEFDFYVAIDDLKNSRGAGHLGETAFNSATYYKYINIHWEALVSNLAGDSNLAMQAVNALIRTTIFSVPTSKQNSFAHNNPPDWVLIEVRPQNIPLSYANAFSKPVRTPPRVSLMDDSVQVLSAYIAQLDKTYKLPVSRALITTLPDAPEIGTPIDAWDGPADWLASEMAGHE